MNKLMNKVRKNKKGFTLIELIVVITILGILVLLAAPRFLGYTKDAKVATMQADAKVLSNAALVYNIEKGVWPVVDEETVIATIKIGQGAEEFDVVAIDKNKLSDQVQSLKGKYEEYGIVIAKDNPREGEIFRIGEYNKDKGKVIIDTEKAAVTGKDGNKHFGIDLVDTVADEADNVTIIEKLNNK